MQLPAHHKQLKLDGPPLVMGIINVTPDSFYAASRADAKATVRRTAADMIAAGADIIDIGGESSRPGAAYLSLDDERMRVLPAVETVRSFSDIPISIDTRKSAVARDCLEAGADMINDISALNDDDQMASTVAEFNAYLILMHKRGTPENMQHNPSYEDTLREISTELAESVKIALDAGVDKNRIILDPGIGFGKRQQDNLLIIRELENFRDLGYPLLMGHSRKSFLERITGRPVEERLPGSLAAGIMAQLNGAAILRVHDVAATVDAVRVVAAVQGAKTEWNG